MCKQLRHYTEWFSSKIHIQACYHNSFSLIRKMITNFYNFFIKELYLINCDYIITIVYVIKNFSCIFNIKTFHTASRMRDNRIFTVSIIYFRFKYCYFFLCIFQNFNSTNKFFCLTCKHTARNNFQPSLFILLIHIFTS